MKEVHTANLELTEREMLDKLSQTWEAISSIQRIAYNGFREIKPFLLTVQGTPSFDREARPYSTIALRYANDNEYASNYMSDRLNEQLRGRRWKISPEDPKVAIDELGGKHNISHFMLELENLSSEMKMNFVTALEIAKHNLERTFQTRLAQVKTSPATDRPHEEVEMNATNKD